MTHLSDFSYLQRCAIWVYVLIYFAHSIYAGDRFKCLRPRSIISGELKSIITILILLFILMQFMYDAASTFIKYNEGFIVYEGGKIISKPFVGWTEKHQSLSTSMDYVECVTFSLQTGVLFMMQSFWNYLSNTYAKKSFMGSLEFKFYILWAVGSMAMFPILQWVFRDDTIKREGVPQLAYGIEALLASLLGARSHYRFRRIILLSEKNNGASNRTIVTRLSYFRDMNIMISVILFFYSCSFIILCADGLTDKMLINSNKFATDTLIANVNVCTVFLVLLMISIFHPRPQYSREIGESSRNDYSGSYVKSTQGRTVNYVVDDDANDSKFMGSAINTTKTGGNAGGFMRAMSPVTVDYPRSLSNETIPLASSVKRSKSPSEKEYNTRSVAIEDPYSNEPVMFNMMDLSKQAKTQPPRYGTPTSPISPTMSRQANPNYGMNRSVSSRGNTTTYDDDAFSYEQASSPTQIRRPSWERTTNTNDYKQQNQTSDKNGDRMIQDWLWQSPDRRNP